MNRNIFFALASFVLAIINPNPALAQDGRPCRLYLKQVGQDGTVVRICADTVRQMNAAGAAVGVLNPNRTVATSVSPDSAQTFVSGQGFGAGGWTMSPPPVNPRYAWEFRDALQTAVNVTAYEEGERDAAQRAYQAGQMQQLLREQERARIRDAAQAAEIRRLRAEAAKALATKAAPIPTPAPAPTATSGTAVAPATSVTAPAPTPAPAPPKKGDDECSGEEARYDPRCRTPSGVPGASKKN